MVNESSLEKRVCTMTEQEVADFDELRDNFYESIWDQDTGAPDKDICFFKSYMQHPVFELEKYDLVIKFTKYGDPIRKKHAEELVLLSHLRLVCSQLSKDSRLNNLDVYSECFEEALIKMVHAIKSYDCDQGNRFSSYIMPWIAVSRQRIPFSVNTIRTPVALTLRIKHVVGHYKTKGMSVTSEKIADLLDVPIENVDAVLNALNLRSLDDKAGEDRTLGEIVGDSDRYEKIDQSIDVENLLRCLNPRSRDMVECYNGINGPKMTLEELGKKYGVSRERIRQILEASYEKIRKRDDIRERYRVRDML